MDTVVTSALNAMNDERNESCAFSITEEECRENSRFPCTFYFDTIFRPPLHSHARIPAFLIPSHLRKERGARHVTKL